MPIRRSIILTCFLVVSLSGCVSDRNVGGECQNDSDCADRCLTEFPRGMCTTSCQDDNDCPGDTVCADTEGGVCLFPCTSSQECTDRLGTGYACDDETSFDGRELRVCEDSG